MRPPSTDGNGEHDSDWLEQDDSGSDDEDWEEPDWQLWDPDQIPDGDLIEAPPESFHALRDEPSEEQDFELYFRQFGLGSDSYLERRRPTRRRGRGWQHDDPYRRRGQRTSRRRR